MATEYVTKAGDTAESVAWSYYGTCAAGLAILQANRGLADYGPTLPAGITLTLPELVPQTETKAVRLWD